MKTIRGCMKDERKKNIFIIFAAVAFCIILSGNIYNSIQSYRYRRLCNELRNRVTYAENTNRTLELTIEQCQSICRELGGSIDRNINAAREAVELIEQIRTQVYELESRLGIFNQSEYYQYWDSYFRDEGIVE